MKLEMHQLARDVSAAISTPEQFQAFALTLADFRRVLRECGMSLIGQTSEIAPADKKIYALRDVTATVESIGLICAPIVAEDQILGLIHLYSTSPRQSLSGEDLEFALAVSRQLGTALYALRRQASLSAENRNLREQLGLPRL